MQRIIRCRNLVVRGFVFFVLLSANFLFFMHVFCCNLLPKSNSRQEEFTAKEHKGRKESFRVFCALLR